MKAKATLASALAFFFGGWFYGLVVAWQVDRAEFLQERIILCLFTSVFFLLLGVLLGILSGATRSAIGFFTRRAKSDSAPASVPSFGSCFVTSFGEYLFLLSLLFAVVDVAIGLAFRQDIPRAWLLSRVLLMVASGMALAWFCKRVLVRLLSSRQALRRRVLAAGLGLAVLVTLIPQPGSGGASQRPPVPVLGMVSPAHRVILFGLDGGTWKIIDRLLAKGGLPFMQRLIDNGVRVRLHSPPPHVSPAVWTTIATGQPATVHGVEQYLLVRIAGVRPFTFEALARKYLLLPFFAAGLGGYLAGVADGVPPTSDMVRAAPLWKLVDAAGLASVVVTWPCTWPAEAVRGLLLSDAFGPGEFDVFLKQSKRSEALVHPPEALEWIEPLQTEPDPVGLSVIGKLSGLGVQERSVLVGFIIHGFLPPPAVLLEKTLAADMSRLDVAARALRLYKPALLALVFNSADMAMHAFWPQRFPDDFGLSTAPHPGWGRLIDDAFRLADQGMARLLGEADEDTVLVVVSDHGMGPDPGNLIWPGWHDSEAILIISGGPSRRGVEIEGVTYTDVFPTILYLLGLQIPAGLPGRVMAEAIDPDYLSQHPPVERVPLPPGQ